MRTNVTVVVLLAVLLGLAGTAQASWQLVDNFSTETPNITISGQTAPLGGVWNVYNNVTGSCTSQVVANTTGSGPTQVLQMTNSTANTGANFFSYLPLKIPANTANATVFFQIYAYTSSSQGALAGLSSLIAPPFTPTNYAGYDTFITGTGVAGAPVIYARSNATVCTMLTGSSTPTPYAGGRWFDVWQVYHTTNTPSTGTYDVYIGDANGNILTSSLGLTYRTATTSMNTLFLGDVIQTTTPSTGQLDPTVTLFANIYFDPSADSHLSLPTTASFTVTANQPVGGSVAYAPISATYAVGTPLTITATSSGGDWHFINWIMTGGGTLSGQTGNDTLTVYGNVVLSAFFSEPVTLTVNPTSNGNTASVTNSVAPDYPLYYPGNILIITASANIGQGYGFVNWSATGATVLSSTATQTTLLLTGGNVTLQANFGLVPHTLTSTACPWFGASNTVANGSYTAGATQTVATVATNSNYVFVGWTVSDPTATVSPSNATTATFTMGANNCVLTAVYNCVINRVPLNISNGFNMALITGPIVASQASVRGYDIPNWLGWEHQGFAFTMFSNNGGGSTGRFLCNTSSNDGYVFPYYTYICGYSASANYTGSQGLPENGLLYSKADASTPRTYCIASVSGNYILPGDWTEPAYISASNGTLLGINGANTIYYSASTYTASNCKFNAIMTGSTLGNNQVPAQGGWKVASVTASVQPGYYSDINFVLSGEFTSARGCIGSYIWANYATAVNGKTSAPIYTWGNGYPVLSESFGQTVANFTQVFNGAKDTGALAGTGNCTWPNGQNAVGTGIPSLSEFTTPPALDPNRLLVSITIGNSCTLAQCEIAVFAATATPNSSASNTLTLNQTTGGATSASPLLTGNPTWYPSGATVTLTASSDISQGYHFNGWNISPAGTYAITGNTAVETLTIYGNVTVSAIFAQNVSYSSTTAIIGGGTISVPSGTYSAGQVITISATAASGFTFIDWLVTGQSTLGNPNALTTTMTVNSNFSLTAVFAVVPTQLQLSGAFNMDTIIGPVLLSQAHSYGRGLRAWVGYEPQGLALLGNAGYAGFWQNYYTALICDTSSKDNLNPYTYNGTAYAGTQALPENGIIPSLVDGRNYMIASPSGNALLSGDWVDPVFDLSKSGTVVGSGTNTVIYGSTTYTASNPKFNTMLVGEFNSSGYYSPSWVLTSLTATFTPGYYKDINFAMKGPTYGLNYGAAAAEIWANYDTPDASGSYSQLLYRFVAGEMTQVPVNAANFNILYTCADSAEDGATTGAEFALLYEFSSPKTLDSARQLTGITLSYNPAHGTVYSELAVYGATVTPLTPGYMQVDTAVAPAGTGTVASPSSGNYFAIGSSLTVTATPAYGYNFASWTVNDSIGQYAAAASVDLPTSANATLTTGSNTCLLTASFTPQTVTLNVTTSGGGTATANVAGPYYYGQVVPISITPSIGWQLSSETLVNCTYATNSLTLTGNATAQFNFTQINYTVSGKALYLGLPGGGTVSWSPTGTQHYGTVVTFSETPAQYYYLVGWTMSGTGTFDTNNATSTTITAQVLTSNLTMTASFNLIAYTETGSPSAVGEGSATISPTPAGGFTPGNGQNVAIITATASDGWVFSFWSLPPGSIDSITPSVGAANYMTHLYVYDNNYLPTADFVVITSTLTTNPSDSGTVTLDGAASTTGTIGQVINLVATAAPGYTFSYWTVTATDSDSVAYVTTDFSSSVANPNAANTTLTIPDFGPVDLGNAPITDMNLTVTANFVVSGTGVQTFSVTINQTTGGNVSITGGPSYNSGDTPTITATPSAGYSFTSWNVLGDTAANVSPTTLDPINADVTLSANFAQIDYSDTLTQVGGSITIPAGPYTYGEVLVIQANPDAGFHFSGWSVTGPSTLSDSAALTTSLTVLGDFDLSAEFAADIYNVTLVQPSGGTIAASSLTASYNQVVTLSQTPAGTSSVFQGYLVTSGTSQITGGDLLTVTGDVTVTGSYTAEVFSATAVTSTNWVYQNTRVTTADRHQIHLTVNMVDTWGNTSYTATVSQTGPGVVTPALTWVSGTTVTPTGAAPVVWTVPASTTFSGYLLGGRVSGAINSTANLNLTGNCTLTVRVQGNVSGPANLATTPTVTIFVRPLGGMAGANSVTTTDKNDLNSRLNGGLLGWDPNIWNLDGISGPTTTQKNILNTLLNGATLQ